MEDSKIIDLFFARNEQALVETDHKYGRYCFTLANAILSNAEDSEEIVSDTYMKVWDAIPPRRPSVLKMFLAKITRNLSFTRWRSETAQKRGGTKMAVVLDELEECIPDRAAVDDQINLKDLTQSIRTFLDTQSIRDQNIFLRRYFFVEETEVIAASYGMRPDTVLRTLSRMRAKLRKHLVKEGYTV